jgi:tetratricopeptide (TPR) repeat protein
MINPNDATIYLGRGMACKAHENYSKAISDLNKAIELDTNYVK